MIIMYGMEATICWWVDIPFWHHLFWNFKLNWILFEKLFL